MIIYHNNSNDPYIYGLRSGPAGVDESGRPVDANGRVLSDDGPSLLVQLFALLQSFFSTDTAPTITSAQRAHEEPPEPPPTPEPVATQQTTPTSAAMSPGTTAQSPPPEEAPAQKITAKTQDGKIWQEKGYAADVFEKEITVENVALLNATDPNDELYATRQSYIEASKRVYEYLTGDSADNANMSDTEWIETGFDATARYNHNVLAFAGIEKDLHMGNITPKQADALQYLRRINEQTTWFQWDNLTNFVKGSFASHVGKESDVTQQNLSTTMTTVGGAALNIFGFGKLARFGGGILKEGIKLSARFGSIAAAAGSGAAYGALYSVGGQTLDQTTNFRENYDWKAVAQDTAISTVAAPAMAVGFNKAGQWVGKALNGKTGQQISASIGGAMNRGWQAAGRGAQQIDNFVQRVKINGLGLNAANIKIITPNAHRHNTRILDSLNTANNALRRGEENPGGTLEQTLNQVRDDVLADNALEPQEHARLIQQITAAQDEFDGRLAGPQRNQPQQDVEGGNGNDDLVGNAGDDALDNGPDQRNPAAQQRDGEQPQGGDLEQGAEPNQRQQQEGQGANQDGDAQGQQNAQGQDALARGNYSEITRFRDFKGTITKSTADFFKKVTGRIPAGRRFVDLRAEALAGIGQNIEQLEVALRRFDIEGNGVELSPEIDVIRKDSILSNKNISFIQRRAIEDTLLELNQMARDVGAMPDQASVNRYLTQAANRINGKNTLWEPQDFLIASTWQNKKPIKDAQGNYQPGRATERSIDMLQRRLAQGSEVFAEGRRKLPISGNKENYALKNLEGIIKNNDPNGPVYLDNVVQTLWEAYERGIENDAFSHLENAVNMLGDSPPSGVTQSDPIPKFDMILAQLKEKAAGKTTPDGTPLHQDPHFMGYMKRLEYEAKQVWEPNPQGTVSGPEEAAWGKHLDGGTFGRRENRRRVAAAALRRMVHSQYRDKMDEKWYVIGNPWTDAGRSNFWKHKLPRAQQQIWGYFSGKDIDYVATYTAEDGYYANPLEFRFKYKEKPENYKFQLWNPMSYYASGTTTRRMINVAYRWSGADAAGLLVRSVPADWRDGRGVYFGSNRVRYGATGIWLAPGLYAASGATLGAVGLTLPGTETSGEIMEFQREYMIKPFNVPQWGTAWVAERFSNSEYWAPSAAGHAVKFAAIAPYAPSDLILYASGANEHPFSTFPEYYDFSGSLPDIFGGDSENPENPTTQLEKDRVAAVYRKLAALALQDGVLPGAETNWRGTAPTEETKKALTLAASYFISDPALKAVDLNAITPKQLVDAWKKAQAEITRNNRMESINTTLQKALSEVIGPSYTATGASYTPATDEPFYGAIMLHMVKNTTTYTDALLKDQEKLVALFKERQSHAMGRYKPILLAYAQDFGLKDLGVTEEDKNNERAIITKIETALNDPRIVTAAQTLAVSDQDFTDKDVRDTALLKAGIPKTAAGTPERAPAPKGEEDGGDSAETAKEFAERAGTGALDVINHITDTDNDGIGWDASELGHIPVVSNVFNWASDSWTGKNGAQGQSSIGWIGAVIAGLIATPILKNILGISNWPLVGIFIFGLVALFSKKTAHAAMTGERNTSGDDESGDAGGSDSQSPTNKDQAVQTKLSNLVAQIDNGLGEFSPEDFINGKLTEGLSDLIKLGLHTQNHKGNMPTIIVAGNDLSDSISNQGALFYDMDGDGFYVAQTFTASASGLTTFRSDEIFTKEMISGAGDFLPKSGIIAGVETDPGREMTVELVQHDDGSYKESIFKVPGLEAMVLPYAGEISFDDDEAGFEMFQKIQELELAQNN